MKEDRVTADETLPNGLEVAEAYRRADFDDRPPAAVERKILSAARRRAGRRIGWRPPLAVAASVLLGGSLVLLLQYGGRSPLLQGSGPPDAPAADEAAIAEPMHLQRTAPADSRNDEAATTAAGDPPACSPEARDEPAQWLACIDTLTGTDSDAAARELEQFRQRYPGQLPADFGR